MNPAKEDHDPAREPENQEARSDARLVDDDSGTDNSGTSVPQYFPIGGP